jgi:hypothetical protein
MLVLGYCDAILLVRSKPERTLQRSGIRVGSDFEPTILSIGFYYAAKGAVVIVIFFVDWQLP